MVSGTQTLADSAEAGALLPVSLPHACQFDLSARDGARYRLLVSIPPGVPPAAGFPVMVLLDGHALFTTATAAAALQAQRPQVTGLQPAVFIGIGYPGEAPFDAERRQRDLLPLPGGAARFLDTIVEEILPAVARLAPLDPLRRSLVGHSYGGLFVLHALFTRPGLFAAHVAGSPSIWWNDRAILANEDDFRRGTATAGRLLITVGGDEQGPGVTSDPRRAERLAMARMRDNAGEMAARLAASSRVDCTFAAFPGENHVSVIPPMLSRAVAFALADRAHERTVAA